MRQRPSTFLWVEQKWFDFSSWRVKLIFHGKINLETKKDAKFSPPRWKPSQSQQQSSDTSSNKYKTIGAQTLAPNLEAAPCTSCEELNDELHEKNYDITIMCSMALIGPTYMKTHSRGDATIQQQHNFSDHMDVTDYRSIIFRVPLSGEPHQAPAYHQAWYLWHKAVLSNSLSWITKRKFQKL